MARYLMKVRKAERAELYTYLMEKLYTRLLLQFKLFKKGPVKGRGLLCFWKVTQVTVTLQCHIINGAHSLGRLIQSVLLLN